MGECAAPCRCATCSSDWFEHGWVCPHVLRLRRGINIVHYDSLVEHHFTSLVRMPPDVTPGSLQAYLSEDGVIIGPSIAHSLCALSRWRWIILHVVCTRHGWRWHGDGWHEWRFYSMQGSGAASGQQAGGQQGGLGPAPAALGQQAVGS